MIQLPSTDRVLSVDSDLKTARELTWELRTKWSNFGLQLGITKDDIEVRVVSSSMDSFFLYALPRLLRVTLELVVLVSLLFWSSG